MRLSGRRAVLGLALAPSLLAISLLAKAAPTGRASAGSSSAAPAGKKASVQTRPTQTRPTQAHPARQHPAQTRPVPVKGAAKEAPRTFTDEDLKRYHPEGSAQPARKAVPSDPSDPLKSFKDEEERARWRQARTAELQKKVLDLEAKLKVLENKRLSIRNPLVPRPAEPEGTAQAESGLSGPELLARVEEEIRWTTRHLEDARKELATFQENHTE